MPMPTIPFIAKLTRSVAGRPYLSQFSGEGLQIAYGNMPLFEFAISSLELATGFKWRVTSMCRQSPSHKRGVAVDVAPDISHSSERYYAVSHMSDPVLYKREKLIRLMQNRLGFYLDKCKVHNVTFNYFIEPDHIHLHLSYRGNPSGRRSSSAPLFRIIKFGGPKACYKDTKQRSALPLHTGNRPIRSAFSPKGL